MMLLKFSGKMDVDLELGIWMRSRFSFLHYAFDYLPFTIFILAITILFSSCCNNFLDGAARGTSLGNKTRLLVSIGHVDIEGKCSVIIWDSVFNDPGGWFGIGVGVRAAIGELHPLESARLNFSALRHQSLFILLFVYIHNDKTMWCQLKLEQIKDLIVVLFIRSNSGKVIFVCIILNGILRRGR